jgi:hypothetical protein
MYPDVNEDNYLDSLKNYRMMATIEFFKQTLSSQLFDLTLSKSRQDVSVSARALGLLGCAPQANGIVIAVGGCCEFEGGRMKQAGLHRAKLPLRAIFAVLTLGLSTFESVSAEECLSTPRQLLERKLSNRWKELHQKDNQPLLLTISAGQGDELRFVGRKPDGSTWISGAMSVCSYAGNRYQVKLERIDQAPFLVAQNLTGMSDRISAGSPNLKFGSGRHCGNPDPCIEFEAQ